MHMINAQIMELVNTAFDLILDHAEVEEIQQDATVCRYLFTAKLLYIFRASIAPVIRST